LDHTVATHHPRYHKNWNKQISLKTKSTMDLIDDDEDEPTGPSTLSIFHEDIILAILSYVADVPFEKVDTVTGEKERALMQCVCFTCPAHYYNRSCSSLTLGPGKTKDLEISAPTPRSPILFH
jgi:hypothetical protein